MAKDPASAFDATNHIERVACHSSRLRELREEARRSAVAAAVMMAYSLLPQT